MRRRASTVSIRTDHDVPAGSSGRSLHDDLSAEDLDVDDAQWNRFSSRDRCLIIHFAIVDIPDGTNPRVVARRQQPRRLDLRIACASVRPTTEGTLTGGGPGSYYFGYRAAPPWIAFAGGLVEITAPAGR